jgi:hypothetical protein
MREGGWRDPRLLRELPAAVMPMRDARGGERWDVSDPVVGDVAGLAHAGVIAADLPDGRPTSSGMTAARVTLFLVALASFPLIALAVFLVQRAYGLSSGSRGTAMSVVIAMLLPAVVVGVALIVMGVIGARANSRRWRDACAAIRGSGRGDVDLALRQVFGEPGPYSWAWYWTGLFPKRRLDGTLDAPMTIVSRQLADEIAAIAPVPGLLEPEAIVQTLGRGHRGRRIVSGIAGAMMIVGFAGQLPAVMQLKMPMAALAIPQLLTGLFFLSNAILGSRFARWRADRAGPADAPFWCGPGWVRWNRGRGRHVTWTRADSVMVVLAVGNFAVSRWGEVKVLVAGPDGMRQFKFDGIDAEFARLWRAWTAPDARDPDTGAPVQAREL